MQHRSIFPYLQFAFLAIMLSTIFTLNSCKGDQGDQLDGDQLDGDLFVDGDGDTLDGDQVDGDEPDGDDPDGDAPDGDMAGDGDGGEGDEAPDKRAELAGGGYSLKVDADTAMIVVMRGETELLRLPADGIQLGVADEARDDYNYDPWPLITADPVYTPPENLRWLDISSVDIKDADSVQISLSLTFEEDYSADLTIGQSADGNYGAQILPGEGSVGIVFFRLRPLIDEDEGFYGLGEYFDQVNHRGKKRAMQIVAASTESGYNEAHVPVPFIIGTTGWGLFAECPFPGTFEVADDDVGADRVQVTFGTGIFSNDGFTFHLFAADHPLDVTKQYFEITGYPTLPAPWALGPWVWRDEVNGGGLPFQNQELVEYDLNTIRDEDLATSAYWIDRPYANGVNSFDFNDVMFPDAPGMIALAHDLGFRLALWHTPYVSSDRESNPRTIALDAEAVENGYYPPTVGLAFNNWGAPIDFTNPEAFDWWQALIKEYVDMGIEGFKLDYGEDIVPGVFSARNKWKFFDGSDERTMHALYQRYYHSVYAEALPEDYFLICRGGTYGDQKYANVIWPGDLDGSLYRHGEEHDDCRDGKPCVGGLPAAVVASQTLGPSGFPFFGSDSGGYRQEPDKETYMRWFEHTALSSVMQVGTGDNNVPWEFNDDEVLDTYRIYARLHLRLWAYEWTYAQNIRKDGRPIQRSLGLAYPELGRHPWDTYLFGDHLLVAPVTLRDARSRDVILPTGQWLNWWTGEVYEGGQTVTVEAPLDRLPLFLKGGGIVPLLRPTIDAIAEVAQVQRDRVDSYATTPGRIYPVIFRDPAESSFTLFDGTRISQSETADSSMVGISEGDTFIYGSQFKLPAFGDTKPSSVTDGETLFDEKASLLELEQADEGWFYDAQDGGVLHIRVKPGDHQLAVSE